MSPPLAASPPVSPPSTAVVPFVLRHLWGLLALGGRLVGGGLLRAIWRRQLSWGAVAWGAVWQGGVLVALDHAVEGGWEPTPLTFWSLLLGAAGVLGLVHAWRSRRIGVWESYLVCALGAGVAGLRLGGGPQQLWSRALGDGGDFAFASQAYGSTWTRLLGPLWDRLVVLGAVGCLLAAIMGGSVAVLFLAEGVRPDTGLRLEWALARRSWRGHGGGLSAVSWVAMLGVGLGVASLVTVNAVMSGYQTDIRDKILATHAHVVVQKYGLDFYGAAEVMQQAESCRGVRAAAPFVFNEVMLSGSGAVQNAGRGVLLKGIDPRRAAQVTSLHQQLCDPAGLPQHCRTGSGPAEDEARTALLAQLLGEPAEPAGAAMPPLLVGWELYQQLGQPTDGWVTLTVPVGLAGARGGLPQRQPFRIAGVFRGGMYEFDARLVYAGLPAAQALFGMPQRISGIELQVEDPPHVERLTPAIREAIGGYPYRVNDWRELNAGLFTALSLQKVVMFLVLCCMVVVASFNIAATLFMAVVEKTHDIAVLKTMGARDSSIMKIFVLQGWMAGLCGTLLGLGLGSAAALLLGHLHLGIAADVYMVDALRVRLQPFDVGLVAFASLSISHLATLYPALQAAARLPAVALRL